jgi:nucleoside-diphosphate-sugar epimerase
MKMLVTGGSGRIGRATVALLRERGHAVTNFDLTAPAGGAGGAAVRLGDIHDLGELASALRGHDALVHLARTSTNHTKPVVFHTNVMGSYNALEAAAIAGVMRVVVASSINALQPFNRFARPPAYLPFDEAHPQAPVGAYGLAKALVEQVCAAYTREHGLLTVAIRPTLVIGPDEYDRTLRPRLAPDAGPWGVRAYVDSRDVAQLAALALERLPLGEHRVYFVNAGDAGSIVPLADLLPAQYPDVPGIGDLSSSLTGTSPGVSTARAAQEVGYEPRYSWRDRYPELAARAASGQSV